MKIKDFVDDETKRKLYAMDKPVKKKRKEKITRRDLIELMGINRDIYKRGKGGAWRRK